MWHDFHCLYFRGQERVGEGGRRRRGSSSCIIKHIYIYIYIYVLCLVFFLFVFFSFRNTSCLPPSYLSQVINSAIETFSSI